MTNSQSIVAKRLLRYKNVLDLGWTVEREIEKVLAGEPNELAYALWHCPSNYEVEIQVCFEALRRLNGTDSTKRGNTS